MSDDTEKFQVVFDTATAALLKQNAKSARSVDNACYYRHPDAELRCAIGHLLSDDQMEKYHVNEGDSPSSFDDTLLAEILPGVHYIAAAEFLSSLQRAHDNANHSDFRNSFIETANVVACQYGLNPIKL